MRISKKSLITVAVFSILTSTSFAGIDLGKVSKIGERYCSKALPFLFESNYSQLVTERLRKEISVFNSLCAEDGHFIGNTQAIYPSTIPINIGSILDSWQVISNHLHAGRSSSAPIALNWLSEAKVVMDSVTPYLRFYKDEYSVELKKKGVTDDKVILKAFGHDRRVGENSNIAIRKSK